MNCVRGWIIILATVVERSDKSQAGKRSTRRALKSSVQCCLQGGSLGLLELVSDDETVVVFKCLPPLLYVCTAHLRTSGTHGFALRSVARFVTFALFLGLSCVQSLISRPVQKGIRSSSIESINGEKFKVSRALLKNQNKTGTKHLPSNILLPNSFSQDVGIVEARQPFLPKYKINPTHTYGMKLRQRKLRNERVRHNERLLLVTHTRILNDAWSCFAGQTFERSSAHCPLQTRYE